MYVVFIFLKKEKKFKLKKKKVFLILGTTTDSAPVTSSVGEN